MTKGFICQDCEQKVTIEAVARMGDRIVLLGKCNQCGSTIAVDVEKLFIAFYTPEEKGN